MLGSCSLFAQDRKALESKRKKLLSEIALTSKVLKETAKNRAAALDQYTTLQTQIKKRKELISTLQSEMQMADVRINRNGEVIESMKSDIEVLIEEYGTLLQHAFRQKLNQSTLWFLLSAGSFNQALQRWRYIKQYESYRRKQSTLIIETRELLAKKQIALQNQRLEKEILISAQEEQQKELEDESERRNEILRSLRRDEKRLKADLENQRIAHEQLNQAIENVIVDIMRNRRRESRSSEALKPSASGENSAALTTAFRRNKKRLNWPVENGVITKWFGEQQHPTLPKVKIRNNGIDIRTEKNAIVKAVFDGVVAGSQFVPGNNNMLIIRHGDYYSVYGNLDVVFVEKGDRINARQHIGRVSVSPSSGMSEMHFEVWRAKARLNPADWLKQ